MKKILFFVFISFLLISCRTMFDPALLKPTPGSINPKLPRLKLQDKADEIRYSQEKVVTSNSKMYTLFEREIENICEQKGDFYGSIEPIITINEVSVGYGFYVLSMLTLTIPNLVGMPIITYTYQLEVEFEIKDLKNDRVWKKTYYDKKKIYYGYYYNLNKRVDEQILNMYRKMIVDFKNDLQKDSDEVARNLKL